MSQSDALTCLPGQRLVHGKVWTFDADALKTHSAELAVQAAPQSLVRLSDGDLSLLRACALRLYGRHPLAELAGAVLNRIGAERHRRGYDTAGARRAA